VAPSEEPFHWPPLLAVSRKRRATDKDEQQSTKKKTMKTNTTKPIEGRARVQSEQGFRAQPEMAKYLVICWQGREQVVTLPFQAKHAEILRYVSQECGEVQAISAGFFIDEQDAFWHGGESTSLNLKSRPEDKQLIQVFLTSADRRQWDLTIAAAEAEAAAR